MDTELRHQEHLANNFLEKTNKWVVNICLNQAWSFHNCEKYFTNPFVNYGAAAVYGLICIVHSLVTKRDRES